ncbi:carbohydrate ABC transporter permease [Paractinoplanes globisporus]|uniref:Carbohydrate ABC transporter permease n=1 Tax=Paractinoplanes globisporus TaxID=113565 RepID=A0ABW6WVA2_9ACTN|nr:carbohydrate ABC transporter permease [Actinoplanes globisporus]
MSTVAPLATDSDLAAEKPSAAAIAKKRLSSPWASLAAIVIAVLWTIPTFGLLISSFRPERQIKRTGWWTFFSDPTVTLDNYRSVFGQNGGVNMADFFVNSLVICIPSVLIPLALASLAAYAFAWINFRGKNFLFIAIFALQIVPLQITLIPLLEIFVHIHITGTFWTLWLAHSTFALPLAIYLLHNFMREVPAGLIEAARVDGAGHVAIFFRVMLPLLTPALAAFGIFQFLWVWNDLLVALVFAGGGNEVAPITLALANLSGTRGTAWQLLSAGAFVSIAVPVLVFLLLQRYFVRGLLAGSVKG